MILDVGEIGTAGGENGVHYLYGHRWSKKPIYQTSWAERHASKIYMYMYMCLGCAVLLCLVCLFNLACFFLSSFLLISHLKTCIAV